MGHAVDQPGRLRHRRRRHPEVRERDPRRASRRRAATRPRRARSTPPATAASARTAGQPRRRPRRTARAAGSPTTRPPPPRPARPGSPVSGNRYRPLSWSDRVSAPGSRVRQRLDAVAVVDVEVDVQDAQPLGPRPDDRQRRVVVDAEAPRLRRHRVVEAAARVVGVVDVRPREDRLHRRAATRPRRSPTPRACPANAGLSDRPDAHRARPARAPPTAAGRSRGTRAGGSASSSVVRSPAPGASPGSAPTARSRSIPGPNRRGVSGWRRAEVVGAWTGARRPAADPARWTRTRRYPPPDRCYHRAAWTSCSS